MKLTVIAVRCNYCTYQTPERPVSIVIGLYLVHIVKMHWDSVVLLHESDKETIQEAFKRMAGDRET